MTANADALALTWSLIGMCQALDGEAATDERCALVPARVLKILGETADHLGRKLSKPPIHDDVLVAGLADTYRAATQAWLTTYDPAMLVTGEGPVEAGVRAVLDHLAREDWGPHTIRVTLDNNGRFTPTEQP